MNMQEHIQFRVKEFIGLLENVNYENKSDINLNNVNIYDNIYNIVTNSKFRRTKIDDLSQIDIKNKIKNCVDSNLPIEFTIPFGGYKNYRIPSFPEAEWAEVFNIKFMIKYLLPITLIYEKGVILTYSYNSQIMHQISNMPLIYQKSYETSISALINFFNNQCPSNFTLKAQRINDLYSSKEDWENEWKGYFERNQKEWSKLYDITLQEKKLQSAKHNLILDGERNLVNLSKEELDKEYLKSAMMCDAIDCLIKRREFNKFSHRIQIVFIRGPRPAVHIGVCEGSTMDFWVGFGVLEIRNDRIIPKILSYDQLNMIKPRIQNIEVENRFSTISKNFSKIFYFI